MFLPEPSKYAQHEIAVVNRHTDIEVPISFGRRNFLSNVLKLHPRALENAFYILEKFVSSDTFYTMAQHALSSKFVLNSIEIFYPLLGSRGTISTNELIGTTNLYHTYESLIFGGRTGLTVHDQGEYYLTGFRGELYAISFSGWDYAFLIGLKRLYKEHFLDVYKSD